MKKFLSLVLVVMMLLATSNAHAVIMKSPDARVKTAVWVGIDSATSSNGVTLGSNNRVVGYQITGTAAAVAGLYDATSVGAATNSTIFDEASAAADASSNPVWYAAPKNLTNGLTVVTNASTTIITVYYE